MPRKRDIAPSLLVKCHFWKIWRPARLHRSRFFPNGAPHGCGIHIFFKWLHARLHRSIFFPNGALHDCGIHIFPNGSMHGCIGPEFFQMALCKVLWFLIAKFSIPIVSRHTEKFPFLLRCNLFEYHSNAVRIQFFACSEFTISCTVLISAIIKACYYWFLRQK